MSAPIYTPMPSEAFILGALVTLAVLVLWLFVLRRIDQLFSKWAREFDEALNREVEKTRKNKP